MDFGLTIWSPCCNVKLNCASCSPELRRNSAATRAKRSGQKLNGDALVRDRLSKPMIEESGEPVAAGEIVNRAIGDVLVPLLGAGHLHAMRAPHQPAIHHRVSDFRVKLDGVTGAVAKRLHGKGIALGEQFAAAWKLEAFTMPLIDRVRPGRAYT